MACSVSVTQELRSKNWKAMEALSSAEKSTQQQISKACEAVKVVCLSATNTNKALVTLLTFTSSHPLSPTVTTLF